jgi:hypothetical protein
MQQTSRDLIFETRQDKTRQDKRQLEIQLQVHAPTTNFTAMYNKVRENRQTDKQMSYLDET